MNISDSIRPSVNLTSHLSLTDVEHISSILSAGYERLSTVLKRCVDSSLEKIDHIDLGMDMKMDLTSYFISEAMGMSRDVANIQKISAYSPDDAANIDELKSSKFFCESEGPESVMRHAELIMGSKVIYIFQYTLQYNCSIIYNIIFRYLSLFLNHSSSSYYY